ncbi:hypothetical protein AB0B89_08430, partial [Sphaerisporangium sp. NPDC049002]
MRIRVAASLAVSLSLGLAACSGGTTAPAVDEHKLDELLVATPAAQGELDKASWNLPFGEPASLDPIKA